MGGLACRPDVLIVQDRSASMAHDDLDNNCPSVGCSTGSKWSHVLTAITNVVQATDASVNWGLKYFADNNTCGASNPPVVPIAAGAGSAIVASLAATAPGGDTPTRVAITAGAAYLQALTDANPKFLLLVTDGLPNCSACSTSTATSACDGGVSVNTDDTVGAEAAVAAAASQGFRTFVVGVGALSQAQNTLNQLAIEGGEPQTSAATAYYAATDEAALEGALTSIVGTVTGCAGP
jgi:hypothetical protein